MGSTYSRRIFLGRSATAAGLSLGSGLAKPAGELLQVALIGAGGRGTALLKAVLQADTARMAALCDIHEGRLATAQKLCERDNPKGYSDYRRLLEDKALDAVFIATPCNLHKAMSVDALGAGKHVYCEKPLATTGPDCNAVARAARSSNRVFQIGQQLRYSRMYQGTVAKIHEGLAGKLLFIRAQRHHGSRSLVVRPGKEWFYDREQSGDIIVENAVHEIDVFNWVNRAHPLKACGMGGCNLFTDEPRGRNVTDHYAVIWEYPGGVHVLYSQADYTHAMVGGGRAEQVHCSKMSVEVGTGKFYEPGKREPSYEVKVDGRDDLNLQAIRSFFDCIRNNRKPFADVEAGRLAALTALVGRTAFYEGRTVRWEEVDKA
jgi:predicted dehydrogenase